MRPLLQSIRRQLRIMPKSAIKKSLKPILRIDILTHIYNHRIPSIPVIEPRLALIRLTLGMLLGAWARPNLDPIIVLHHINPKRPPEQQVLVFSPTRFQMANFLPRCLFRRLLLPRCIRDENPMRRFLMAGSLSQRRKALFHFPTLRTRLRIRMCTESNAVGPEVITANRCSQAE